MLITDKKNLLSIASKIEALQSRKVGVAILFLISKTPTIVLNLPLLPATPGILTKLKD